MSKRIKLTKNDVLMMDNLIHFDTVPTEYKERLLKIIRASQGYSYTREETDNVRIF